jgi:hypothetical protein
MNFKGYTLEHIDKMLDYLKLYCRDFKQIYADIRRLLHHKTILVDLEKKYEDPKRIRRIINKIDRRIDSKTRRYHEWKDELSNMNISVGSIKYGRVDVPTKDGVTGDYIKICIDINTTMIDLEYHAFEESCMDRKPYWGTGGHGRT